MPGHESPPTLSSAPAESHRGRRPPSGTHSKATTPPEPKQAKQKAKKKKVKPASGAGDNKEEKEEVEGLSFDDEMTRRLPRHVASIATTGDASARALGLLTLSDHPLGAIVRDLDAYGEAAAAGLKPGDVLREVDGVRVASCAQAIQAMDRVNEASLATASTPSRVPAGTIRLGYHESSDAEDLLRRKRRPPKLIDFAPSAATIGEPKAPGVLSRWSDLRPLQLDEHPLGLIITSIDASDPAHRAGMRLGDVITTLGGRMASDAVRARDLLLSFARERRMCRVTFLPALAALLELVLIESTPEPMWPSPSQWGHAPQLPVPPNSAIHRTEPNTPPTSSRTASSGAEPSAEIAPWTGSIADPIMSELLDMSEGAAKAMAPSSSPSISTYPHALANPVQTIVFTPQGVLSMQAEEAPTGHSLCGGQSELRSDSERQHAISDASALDALSDALEPVSLKSSTSSSTSTKPTELDVTVAKELTSSFMARALRYAS